VSLTLTKGSGSLPDSDFDPHGPGGLLTLDLARMVGFCYGRREADTPLFGTWPLPHVGGEGGRYAAFENTLAAAMLRFRPGKVLLESTLPIQAMNNYAAAAQQFALRGFAYSEAWRASCPIGEIDVRTVRQALLGFNPSADVAKRQVVLFIRRRMGWRVEDHNAGDACMLWLWHKCQMTGVWPLTGPITRWMSR